MTQTNVQHATTASATQAPLQDYVLVPITGTVVVLAGILIAALCSIWVKRAAAAQAREILESSARLAERIEHLSEALAGADARIAALAGRLEEQSRSSQGAAPTSYNVAIRMARSGATRQEIMTTCGVTQQEADLVLRLHTADSGVRTAA